IITYVVLLFFFFSSRRRHTRFSRDWSSDVCSSDLNNTNCDPIYKKVRMLSIGCNLVSVKLNWHFSRPIIAPIISKKILSVPGLRSEERRVGKECRCGGAPER